MAGWRAGRTNRRAVEHLDYTCKEHAHLLAYSQIGREEGPETEWVTGKFPITAARARTLAWADNLSDPGCSTAQLQTGVRPAKRPRRTQL